MWLNFIAVSIMKKLLERISTLSEGLPTAVFAQLKARRARFSPTERVTGNVELCENSRRLCGWGPERPPASFERLNSAPPGPADGASQTNFQDPANPRITLRWVLITAGCFSALQMVAAEELDVAIDRGLSKVEVKHNGEPVSIMRNQNPENTVDPRYAKTSRKCPPFCIQPMVLADGVETIGELELINYISMAATDDSILVIDSRTPDWVSKGTIPGSVNIPWTELTPAAGADPLQITEILENRFGALSLEGLWDFSNAKTLVLFCNGMWCGQSPTNIKTLLKFGYPAAKIKWYRGGLQDWEILGLTVVK